MSTLANDLNILFKHTKLKAVQDNLPTDIQKACDRIIEQRGTLNSRDPITGDTILHQAIRNGHYNLTLLLLTRLPLKPLVTIKNREGQTVYDLSKTINNDRVEAWVLAAKIAESLSKIRSATTAEIFNKLKVLPTSQLFNRGSHLTADLRSHVRVEASSKTEIIDSKSDTDLKTTQDVTFHGDEISLTAGAASANLTAGNTSSVDTNLSLEASDVSDRADSKRAAEYESLVEKLNDIQHIPGNNDVLKSDLQRCIGLAKILSNSPYKGWADHGEYTFLDGIAILLGDDVFNGACIAASLAQAMLKIVLNNRVIVDTDLLKSVLKIDLGFKEPRMITPEAAVEIQICLQMPTESPEEAYKSIAFLLGDSTVYVTEPLSKELGQLGQTIWSWFAYENNFDRNNIVDQQVTAQYIANNGLPVQQRIFKLLQGFSNQEISIEAAIQAILKVHPHLAPNHNVPLDVHTSETSAPPLIFRGSSQAAGTSNNTSQEAARSRCSIM